MKIRIYLKSGICLPDLSCDEFTVDRNTLTGDLNGYRYTGGLIPRPLFVSINEIAAIVRVCDEED